MDRVNLARHLSSLFGSRVEPILALRIRHADGCRWAVADDTLTLTTPIFTETFSLRQTLLALSLAVTAAGFEVVYLHPDLEHLSGLILVEGQGDQGTSNGDHLLADITPLASLLGAWGGELALGRQAIDAALAQMVLPQAEGEWADVFGTAFGIARGQGTLAYQVATYTLANPDLAATVTTGLAALEAAATAASDEADAAMLAASEVEYLNALYLGAW